MYVFLLTLNHLQATERFEAIYPTLKEVALAGAPGSKAMKQVSQQIFIFAAKAAGESMLFIFPYPFSYEGNVFVVHEQ